MALNFVPASTEWLSNSSLAVTTPFSVSIWMRNNDANGQVCLWSTADSGVGDHRHMLILAAQNGGTGPETPPHLGAHTTAGTWGDADNSTSATAASNDGSTWQHCGGVWASASSRQSYFLGVASTERTTTVSPTSIDRTGIGRLIDLTQNWEFDGDLAECAIWNQALTPEEMLILSLGFSPLFVRRQSLVNYWPIHGTHSPETDIAGAFDMTLNGTPTKSEHPRIYMPSRQIIRSVAAAGAPPAPTNLSMQGIILNP